MKNEPSGANGTVPNSIVSLPAWTMYEWDERVVSPLPASTRIARTCDQPAVLFLVKRAFWQNRKPVARTSSVSLRSTFSANTGGLGREPRYTGECNGPLDDSCRIVSVGGRLCGSRTPIFS